MKLFFIEKLNLDEWLLFINQINSKRSKTTPLNNFIIVRDVVFAMKLFPTLL